MILAATAVLALAFLQTSPILTAQVGSPPEITLVQFPEKIPADGSRIEGKIGFKDPDGDITRVDFEVVEAKDFKPFSFDPGVKGQTEGVFQFYISTTTPQRVILGVTLLDAAGNKSQTWAFPFTAIGPDLVSSIGSVNPPEIRPGETIEVISTVENIGEADTGSFRVGIYLSRDNEITTKDLLLSFRDIDALAPKKSLTLRMTVIIPQDLLERPDFRGLNPWDKIFLGVIADDTNKVIEIDEENNISSLFEVTIADTIAPPPPQDLSVTPSGWTNKNSFVIDWTNPFDHSGIAAAWYKVSSMPNSPIDGIRTASKPFTVQASAEGEQPIYIWLEDGVGNKDHNNRSSGVLHYDGTPPTGSISINNDVVSTDSVMVTLNLRASDTGGSGLSQMKFSNDGTIWSPWEDFSTTKSNWDLSAYGGNTNPGEKTVYAQFKDRAGNESSPSRDAIIFRPQRIKVDPLKIDFERTPVGSSITKEVTVSNVGGLDLFVSSIALSSGIHFKLAFTFAGFKIPPGGSVTFQIAFAPTTGGALTDTVIIKSDDLAEPTVTIPLKGIGNRPPSIDPIAEQTVTVGQTLTLQVKAADPDGDAVTLTAKSLPRNASFPDTRGNPAIGTFRFTPDASQANQTFEVEFVATDNQLQDAKEVIIIVKGWPDIRVDKRPITFGKVPIGSSNSRPLTVSNEGTVDLEIRSIRLERGAPFELVPTLTGAIIRPGASTTFQIKFLPTAAGTFQDTIIIESNDPDEPRITISVSGAGNYPPVVEFNFSPSEPKRQEMVRFTDQSSDPDGRIISWEWDFGDGTPRNREQNPTHSYSNIGTFNVVLKVTDDTGATSTKSKSITVINRPPTASFRHSPSTPTDLEIVQFTDESSDPDGRIISWRWDFGDKITSSEQNPRHRYADDGSYIVTLTVTDNDGASSTTTKSISVTNVAPTADFSYSVSGWTVTFFDKSSDPDGHIVSWQWDFGDGTTSKEQNPTHYYAEAYFGGTYTIKLTVADDDGASSTVTKEVRFEPS